MLSTGIDNQLTGIATTRKVILPEYNNASPISCKKGDQDLFHSQLTAYLYRTALFYKYAAQTALFFSLGNKYSENRLHFQ